MSKIIYKFNKDYGRMGEISGLFISIEEKVEI